MYPLRHLNAAALESFIGSARVAMAAHAPGIDRLDESPFGTGTAGTALAELLAVLDDAVQRDQRPVTMSALAATIDATLLTSGSVPGGSGVECLLGGIAEMSRNAEMLDPGRLSLACEAASERLSELSQPDSSRHTLPVVAVMASVTATALGGADSDPPLADLVISMADAGLDELERRASADDEMAEAGVVDAPSAALLVMLDSLVATVHGEDPELPAWEFPEDWETEDDDHETWPDAGGRYVVSLRVKGSAPEAAMLRTAWLALGTGVEIDAVSGIDSESDDEAAAGTVDGELIASVATDDIGAVIEAAIGVGRPRQIRVNDRRG